MKYDVRETIHNTIENYSFTKRTRVNTAHITTNKRNLQYPRNKTTNTATTNKNATVL
jgi:hypothetical protein